jgi:hypothetical protein
MDFEPDNLTEAALRLVDLSEVLRAAGDLAGAEVALEHAIRLDDEKGTSSRRSSVASGWGRSARPGRQASGFEAPVRREEGSR